MKYLLAIIFLMQLIIFPQYSAYPSELWDTTIDTIKAELRIPSQDIFDKYKNDKTFNYDPEAETVESIWDKIMNWINRQIFGLQRSKAYYTFIDYLLYVLMIAALIIIIFGLIKSDVRGLFYGKRTKQKIKVEEFEEDIHKINFDELITKAIDKKDYKVAVRYLYLKALKILSDEKLIELQINKTNRDYLYEIKKKDLAIFFSQATRSFEFIWYGDFPVEIDLYSQTGNIFNKLYAAAREE